MTAWTSSVAPPEAPAGLAPVSHLQQLQADALSQSLDWCMEDMSMSEYWPLLDSPYENALAQR